MDKLTPSRQDPSYVPRTAADELRPDLSEDPDLAKKDTSGESGVVDGDVR